VTEFEVWRVREAVSPCGRGILACFAWLGLLMLATAAGCSNGSTPEEKATEEAKAFGALSGLKATPDQALQDELARVVEDGGTPELLAAGEIPPDTNVAAGLVALFEGIDRQRLALIRAESDTLFPEGPFTLDPIQREKAIRFRKRYEKERMGARLAMQRPECRFPIQYEAGPADELPFLDAVWICSRLEAFRASEALSALDVDTAVESLRYQLRLAECVAAEPHPIARLEGAFLRIEALLVLQAIVASEGFQRRHALLIHGWLSDQLATWPDDALAWIGDRAQGMVIYEAVRGGRLKDFLTDEEKEQIKETGSFSAFEDAVLRDVNSDQLFYLVAMGQVIESCEYPYHTRVADFEELRRDLHERRNRSDFPLVAGRFLLLDVEKGHVIQARDRANCEAFVMALALACGEKPPELGNNPLTGRPYRVERDAKTVMVFDIGTGLDGDNPPWIVPDMSSGGADGSG
jgi:hypothetical protein